jgi:hypothetical protein
MLTKNIYILYPPGYSGNYISWALTASDLDQADVTKDPVNINSSKKLGGAGTSHNHVRIPTHQGIQNHLTWVLYKQPKYPKTYVINSDINNVSTAIDSILRYDPDPIFILIHDNDNKDVRTYGAINCYLKWPAYIYIQNQTHKITTGNSLIDWDPFDCKDNIKTRNDIALMQIDLPPRMPPLSESTQSLFELEYKQRLAWFHTRNNFHPHEVNDDNYLIFKNFPSDRIYQLSCQDVATDNFLIFLSNFLNNSCAITNADTGYVEQYHKNYITAQKNLQWFDSIAKWRDTGEIDQYLNSHSVIQGFVIREMLETVGWPNAHQTKLQEWQRYYNTIKDASWPECEYPEDVVLLPDRIQHELADSYGVDLNEIKNQKLRNLANLCKSWNNVLHDSESWSTLSLDEINRQYQGLL